MQGNSMDVAYMKFLDDVQNISNTKGAINAITSGSTRTPAYLAECIKKALHVQGQTLQHFFGNDAGKMIY